MASVRPEPPPVPAAAREPRRANLPNALSVSRMVMLPVLWVLAAAGAERTLGAGIAIAVSTDFLDGLFARAFGLRTRIGSRLDSIADHLLTASVVVWLLWLKPELTNRYGAWLLAWGVFAIVTLLVGWSRFRRIGDLHLVSAKVAMVLGYLFVVALFLFDTYRPLHFAIMMGVGFIAVAETLLVYLTRSDPDERIGSILRRGKRRSGRAPSRSG